MKKKLLFSSFDGIIQAILFSVLSMLSISSYFNNSFVLFLIIAIVFAAISTVTFHLIIHKQTSNRAVALSTLTSFMSFLLTVIILLALQISCPLILFDSREVNNADGIFLLFILGTFLGFTVLLKFAVFCISIIKNKRKKHKSHEKK